MILCRRFHLFEVNDQTWWPGYLRTKVQDWLTLTWTIRLPFLQPQSPASLVARTLLRVLGGPERATEFAFVDFASGAGGPTPWIEKEVNKEISEARKRKQGGRDGEKTGWDGGGENATFVLTDLRPHISAWEACSKKSENLGYVPEGVDAADAPKDLLQRVVGGGISDPNMDVNTTARGAIEKKMTGKKIMRLFSLAFHHFDDDLAERILKNTVEKGDAFGIFELQSRTVSSFLTVSLFGPLIAILSPAFFWQDPLQLFFTYLIPLIPFCLVFDGYISSLRTRTPEEVRELMMKAVLGSDRRSAMAGTALDGWRFESGEVMHTWPTGWMSWVICVRE